MSDQDPTSPSTDPFATPALPEDAAVADAGVWDLREGCILVRNGPPPSGDLNDGEAPMSHSKMLASRRKKQRNKKGEVSVFWNFREELSQANRLRRSYYELLRDQLDQFLIQYSLTDSYQNFIAKKCTALRI